MASGGARGYRYPWADSPLEPSFAAYACLADGEPDCSPSDIPAVGSRPDGNARWGHSDLAGSMSEWVLDYQEASLPEMLRTDYVNLEPSANRMRRGGAWSDQRLIDLETGSGQIREPAVRNFDVGIRCARALPPEQPR